jgi:hypothetical protein
MWTTPSGDSTSARTSASVIAATRARSNVEAVERGVVVRALVPDHAPREPTLLRAQRELLEERLGFGRIVASKIEAPNMFVNLV